VKVVMKIQVHKMLGNFRVATHFGGPLIMGECCDF
jgi:hypothetical protein